MRRGQKVLIIGLDGSSWKILNHMMEEDKMPCLKGLVASGTSGILKSSIPPLTAAAWTSFQTGVNPGKHGIIHFQSFDPVTKQIRLVNSNDIKMKTIWELVSEQKKKVISINVPLTYPPRPLNGIVVGGMLSPRVDERFVYPSEVYHEYIKDRGYKIVAGRLERQAAITLQDFVKEQIEVERKRFDLAKKLMKECEWDLFMVHNQLMDPLQHALFPYLDPQSKEYDERKFEEISKFYEECDKFISDLIEVGGPEATVILLSDHGSKGVSCYVNLNTWLRRMGYLRLTSRRYLGELITLIRRLDAHHLLKKILGKLIKSPTLVMRISGRASQSLIDWKKTKVYSINGIIWGNMHFADPQVANQIVEKLKDWKGPVDNKSIVRRIYRKEEIFSGPYLEQLPDIFLEPHNGYAFYTPLIKDMKMFHMVDVARYERVGTHDLEGILVIKGKNIKDNLRIQANIVDLAPTVLSILDISLPSHMDGRVLEEIFIKKPKIRIGETESLERDEPEKYLEDDEKEIERRLKDLGYL